MEFFLFLPAIRLPFERLVATARNAEAAGFTGIVGMDHMVPPEQVLRHRVSGTARADRQRQ